MNRQKIVLGGLAAGLVLNLLDFITSSYIMGGAMAHAFNAVNPSLVAAMGTTRATATFVVTDFVYGIALVWLYSAMRPRYGAGPRNALMSAFFIWLISCLAFSMFHTMGMMGMHLFLLMALIALINYGIAALVGGWLYTE